MSAGDTLPTPDYRVLFETGPYLLLILTPDLRIAAASDAHLQASMTKREDIVGRNVFDVFPESPATASGAGAGP